jgi:signal peptidase I
MADFPTEIEDTPDIPAESVPRPYLISRKPRQRDIAETLLLALSIFCLANLTTARYVVEGPSMFPNFASDQFIIVSRLAYMFGKPARGDVIVFHDPENPAQDFIKRLIGLPGETITIKDGKVYANSKPLDEPYVPELCRNNQCDGTWTLDNEHYFVLGDNRSHSHDSHNFGPLDRSLIIGKAWIRYWPPEDWAIIPHHNFDAGR